MHKMFAHMRKYAGALVLIVVLLVVQALCELNLPSYTASIIDVGVQQQGIEDAAPRYVRESTLQRLRPFMEEGVYEWVEAQYAPAPEGEGFTTTEPVFVLQPVEEQAKLVDIFAHAWLLDAKQSGAMGQGMPLTDGLTPALTEKLKKQLPESMLKQVAVQAVKGEYNAIGIDLASLQNRTIWKKGSAMLWVALLSTCAAVVVGYLGSHVAASLARDLRQKVYSKVLRFGQAEIEHFSTSSLITRTTNDVQQVQNVMVMMLRMVIYAPILAVGGIWRAVQTNASMAWIIVVGVAAVITVVLVLISFGMPRFKRIQVQIDDVNRIVRETLTGLPVIRAFCTQKREEERFDEANKALTKTTRFVGRLMSGMMPTMMLIMNALSLIIVWVGAKGIDAGNMQVGDMMAFIQYTMQIIMSFLMISLMSLMLPRASVSAGRIQAVLDEDFSIAEPKEPTAMLPDQKGVVEFQDVSFRYPGTDEAVLSHISFVAKPGQTTAILGGTGAGKSTLLTLIVRLYDATEGKVLVGGVPVQQLSLANLREGIGYVPQKAVLFSGSVMDNLTFGSPTMRKEQAQQAAQVAQAEGFILERENGYASDIAQGGTNVSGGQKQRLSIARAVAKHPTIYLFDDSFSALDFKTDALVRENLQRVASKATVMIVAQRIATVMHADQIIVLDDGEVVGKGTHKELMQACEVYRQIAQSQLSKEELEHAE